jgi:coproporphyrinogen III oxidase-like Fe-S oxidoreductase
MMIRGKGKAKDLKIIDNTKRDFQSPLDRYIENNCQHCNHWHERCRLEDTRGVTPMNLCISIYAAEPSHFEPEDIQRMLAEVRKQSEKTQEISEATLETLPDAKDHKEEDAEFDGQENPAD